jgi:transcription elongation factor GreB
MIPPSVSFATYLPTGSGGTKPERVEDHVRPRRGRDETSRAFVKEPDEGAPDEGLPERQISDHPNYVTPAGLRQLEQQLGELEERRLELLAAVADDDALARGQLDYVDRDLRYFTRRLEMAILVDPRRQPRRMVKFGAAVTVLEPGGARRTFTIVGEDEADLKVGKISYVSPLAEALLDARAGATVLWRRPAGNRELTIEAIDYPEG